MASYRVPSVALRGPHTYRNSQGKEHRVFQLFRDECPFHSSAAYKSENIEFANYVSPPRQRRSQKVTLKVSQNLHASMTPFVLGALLAIPEKEIDQAGFDLENGFLKKAGSISLPPRKVTAPVATPTPDLSCTISSSCPRLCFLLRAAHPRQRRHAGKNSLDHSPAAGTCMRKPGLQRLRRPQKTSDGHGKGLAGYMTPPAVEHLIVALYANMVALPL